MHKTILVPVFYGEEETQLLLAEDVCLPDCAIKVWDVRPEIRNLTGQVCSGKVIFQGILHKQLLFVNRHNIVQHHSTEVPFSGLIEIPCAVAGMDLRFLKAYVEKDCSHEHLETPSQLHEKHIIVIRVGVFQDEKVCID